MMQAGKELVRSVHCSLTHRSGAGWFLTADDDDVVHLVVVVDSHVQYYCPCKTEETTATQQVSG